METETQVLSIPVVKGKAGNVEFDVYKVPANVHLYAVTLGYKQLVNRGMSKIDKDDKEALMKKAQENVEAILAGKVRIIGATKNKIPGAVMTVARAEAREDVKAALKAAGEKLTGYKASVITQAANALIAQDPSYITRAQAVVDARKKKGKSKTEATEMLAALGITASPQGSAGNVAQQ